MAPADQERLSSNRQLFEELLSSIELDDSTLSAGGDSLRAFVGIVGGARMRDTLSRYEWADGSRYLTRELEYLQGTGPRDCMIDDWVIIAPQLRATPAEHRPWEVGGHQLTVKFRARIEDGGRVKAYSEPAHRRIAQHIIGAPELEQASEHLQSLTRLRRGVMLLYPAAHGREPEAYAHPTMGFAVLFPPNAIQELVAFTVEDPSRGDAAVVDAPGAAVPARRRSARA